MHPDFKVKKFIKIGCIILGTSKLKEIGMGLQHFSFFIGKVFQRSNNRVLEIIGVPDRSKNEYSREMKEIATEKSDLHKDKVESKNYTSKMPEKSH